MSHTSSLSERDGNYNIEYNHHISEFFESKSEIYYNGSYSKTNYPGYYDYININYCLLGTIIENITNERFDLYMKTKVLEPLNITGGFNLDIMPLEVLDEIGTIYKKLTNRSFDINGKWTACMDDFTKGFPKNNYSEYVIGTNGALFGPMGSLRISLTELTHLVYMFLNNGTYNGKVILKPETVEKMFKIIWKYDENKKNGDTGDGYDYAYAGGPSFITNIGKNRIHRTKNLNFSGHTADAYGLFGGVFFDRIRGYGVVYRGNGVSIDLDKNVYDFAPIDVIINTTPVGMYPNNGERLLDLQRFKDLSGVLDLIYNPSLTPIVYDAKNLGIPYCSGLSMLVAQAWLSAQSFIPRELDEGEIERVINILEKKRKNIVLIGMPGSGKSTVSEMLGKFLSREVVDTDKLIEEYDGRKIPEIFAQSGEKYFRDIESKITAQVGKRSGIIISTGGGAVLREENRHALKQNGVVLWLKRDTNELERSGRPLSANAEALKIMEEIRNPIYRSMADYELEVDSDPEKTYQKIPENIL